MSDLKIFFADAARAVDEKLSGLVPGERIEPKRLHKAVRWSLFAGGKRFRPALVLAVGKTFGAAEKDLRRGRATCHKKFDEATAILAGDVLQTLAFQSIAEDENLTADVRIRLISELARAAGTPVGMVAGQQLDLEGEGVKVSIEDLENIHQRKTGAVISFAARAGAIIAGANETELETVSNYAANLGLLFQVTDDLLDVTQTTETLGKTAGKDSAAQKATYPGFYGLEKARKLAENIHAQACRELETIEIKTNLLCEIAGFILNREK